MPAATPAELHPLFVDAFNRGDAEAVLALYEPDAVFVRNSEAYQGYEALRIIIAEFLDSDSVLSIEKTFVADNGQGLALLHAVWTLKPPAGPATNGTSSEIARQQPDGTWLYAIDNPTTPF